MRHRIQAHPTHEPGGVIAQPVRDIRMHELMDRDAEEDGDHETKEECWLLRGALDRRDQPAGQPGVSQ